MALKARHAFGNSTQVLEALKAEKINEFDILFLDGDTKPKIGWIDKNKNFRLVQEEDEVVIVEGDVLPDSGEVGKIYVFGEDAYVYNGTEFVNLCKPTDVSALEAEIDTKVTAKEVRTMIKESEDSLVEIVEF